MTFRLADITLPADEPSEEATLDGSVKGSDRHEGASRYAKAAPINPIQPKTRLGDVHCTAGGCPFTRNSTLLGSMKGTVSEGASANERAFDDVSGPFIDATAILRTTAEFDAVWERVASWVRLCVTVREGVRVADGDEDCEADQLGVCDCVCVCDGLKDCVKLGV